MQLVHFAAGQVTILVDIVTLYYRSTIEEIAERD